MTASDAAPIEAPGVPIIDSHHHLHDRRPQGPAQMGRASRFLIDEYAEAVDGQGVVASVLVESHAMYRQDGPDALRPVGETEFLNGQAAMAASGLYGGCRVGAAIVAHADLTLGDDVRPVIEAQAAAAPDRMRGIRLGGMWDEDPSIVGWLVDLGPHLYSRESFRQGFAHLEDMGLAFDAFVLAPQLLDVAELAEAFPGTRIALNHLGQPLGVGRHRDAPRAAFDDWATRLRAVAEHPNVVVKIGGLGTSFSGLAPIEPGAPGAVERLADSWRPWVEVAVEAFGFERCMFESNLPMDRFGGFATTAAAVDRIIGGATEAQRRALFAGTAARFYRIEPDLDARG